MATSLIRLGLEFKLDVPPFIYRCGETYFRNFSRCAQATNFSGHCLTLPSSCPKPGPGAYLEFFAFILTALKENFTIYDQTIWTTEEKFDLLHNDVIDISPDPAGFTSARSASVMFTTSPFPAGRFSYTLRTDSLYQFREATNYFSYMTAFSAPFWAALVASFISFWFALAIGSTKKSIFSALWETFVKFAGNVFELEDERPSAIRRRSTVAIAFLWVSFAFFMQGLYSNVLTGGLLQPKRPRAIFNSTSELADLIAQEGFRLADFRNHSFYYELLAQGRIPGGEKLLAALKKYPLKIFHDEVEAQDALVENPRLVFVSSIGIAGTFGALTYDTHACAALSMQEDFSTVPRVIAYAVNPARRRLADRFSTLIIRHLNIANMIAFKYNMVGKCNQNPADLEKTSVETMSIVDACGIFVLWLICIAISIIAFVCEHIQQARCYS